MNQKQFENLKRGDLVRHKSRGDAYVVERSHPAVIAVRSIQVTNPTEWNLVDVDGRIRYAPDERRYTKEQILDAVQAAGLSVLSVHEALERLP